MSEESRQDIALATSLRRKTASSPERGEFTIEDFLGNTRLRAAVWCLFLVMTCSMVGHNVILASWGIGTFPSITRRIEMKGKSGDFASTPLIDANGLPTLLRYAKAPAARFLHILPAGLWSVIAPLQLSRTFRSKFRTAHRYLGRLFVTMSLSIGIGLIPILRMDEHLPVRPIPRTRIDAALTLLCAAYFIWTALLAINHARNKRIAEHRVWMLRHVAMGYTVHLQRVLGHVTWWMLPHTLPGYSDHTQEGYQKRTFVFKLYFQVALSICVLSMEIWLRYTSPSGEIIRRNDSSQKAN
ncbi:unnamed protein product [Ascophyllum nodosum]